MQRSSSEPCGASNPVCRIALLALDAPDRMSVPASITTTRAPSKAKRRAIAQPTTPAPMIATSVSGTEMVKLRLRHFPKRGTVGALDFD